MRMIIILTWKKILLLPLRNLKCQHYYSNNNKFRTPAFRKRIMVYSGKDISSSSSHKIRPKRKNKSRSIPGQKSLQIYSFVIVECLSPQLFLTFSKVKYKTHLSI